VAGRGFRGPLLDVARAIYARIVLAEDEQRGATATEYAVLVAFIAVVIVTGVLFFGQNLNSWFHRLGGTVKPFTS
jgi:Flp pilus assembly pilin Flp